LRRYFLSVLLLVSVLVNSAILYAAEDEIGIQLDKFINLDKERKLGGLQGAFAGFEGLPSLINLNFKGVPIEDALTVLSRQAGINITLDKDVNTRHTVSVVYSGNSAENALKNIISGMDLTFRKTPDGFIVTPWKESYINVNKVFEYIGAGGGVGSIQPMGGMQQAGFLSVPSAPAPSMPGGSQPSGTQQVSITDFGGYMNSVMTLIRSVLSREGVITYMPSGFIYVRDYPSRIKAVEEIFNFDNAKREEVQIKINIVRLDYKKEYETGISWSKIFEGFKVGSPWRSNIEGNFLSNLKDAPDVFTFGLKNINLNFDSIIKALGRYGDVKIVHSWETKALAGSVLPFNLTQLVWYSTGATVQVIGEQTITTPQIANTFVGLSLLLNPIKYDEGKYVLNTSVRMSNIVGYQQIRDLSFPNIEDNFVSVPIKIAPGERIVISGFKIKSSTKDTVGVPFLSSLPILGHLFGYKAGDNSTSEIAVIIHLDDMKNEGTI